MVTEHEQAKNVFKSGEINELKNRKNSAKSFYKNSEILKLKKIYNWTNLHLRIINFFWNLLSKEKKSSIFQDI